jgi:hypothetical protein
MGLQNMRHSQCALPRGTRIVSVLLIFLDPDDLLEPCLSDHLALFLLAVLARWPTFIVSSWSILKAFLFMYVQGQLILIALHF